MTFGDWVGVGIGLLGIAFAVYQIVHSLKKENVYRKNRSKSYKDVSEVVITLTEDLISTCSIIKHECLQQQGQCIVLSTNITSAMSLSRQLIRYCKDMEDDFKSDFKTSIDKKLSKQLDDIQCRCLDLPDQIN
jgi:hypothetical protein